MKAGFVGPAGLGVIIHRRRQAEREGLAILAGFVLGRVIAKHGSVALDKYRERMLAADRKPHR